MINLFQPSLGREELQAIEKVFQSNWLGKGKYVHDFEKEFAINLKSSISHFVSTTSCTEAFFLAAHILKFSPEDEVIVPSISFPSIASAIISKGSKIVFCDVEKRSLNVSYKHFKQKITKKTKAVFVTHYGGVPCEMDSIVDLCIRNNIKLIEDSACAIRSFYKGKACGTFGDIGMWSFDAMKTLTTADGGMVYIKEKMLKRIAEEYLYLGIPKKQKSGLDSASSGKAGWWEFQMKRYGKRSIMNDLTASIGLIQLKKLNSFLNRRKEIYFRYVSELEKIKWLTLPPKITREKVPSFYFFWIQTKYRDDLAKYLLKNGVYTTFRYWPLHKVDFFKKYSKNNCYPNSEFIAKNTLNIPIHQSLSDNDVSRIISLIKMFKP